MMLVTADEVYPSRYAQGVWRRVKIIHLVLEIRAYDPVSLAVLSNQPPQPMLLLLPPSAPSLLQLLLRMQVLLLLVAAAAARAAVFVCSYS